MLRKNILFMVLLLGLALTARAQANKQIQLHHVNTKGYAVRVCYRDVNGIMWLGTTSGLLSLPQLQSRNPAAYQRSLGNVNMSIKKICGDQQGRLWIKTIYNDNYFYDPQHDRFVEDTPAMLAEKGASVSSEFYVFTDHDDNTWIWKENRLYWLAKDAAKAEMMAVGADEQLRNLCPVGTQLLALSQKSLLRLSPAKKWLIQAIALPTGYNVRDHLFVAKDETPWIWASGMVWKYDGGQWVAAFQADSDITGIAQDGDQRLWVSTQSNGIYICDRQGQVITHLTHNAVDSYSLLSNRVEMVSYEPVSRTMWIAYTKGGLSVFSNKDNHLLPHKIDDPSATGAVTDVLSFAPVKTRQGTWIGLEGRGVWLHDRQGDHQVVSDGSAVALYAGDAGDLWAGIYRHGLVHRTADGHEHLYLEGTSPYAITEDDQGHIFTALLGKGVWQLDPESGQATDTRLKRKYVFDLEYYQQRLYAASTEGLFVRDRQQQWTKVCDGHFHYLSIDSRGNIWLIGNEGSEGLTLLDADGHPVEVPDHLRKAPLKSIAIDKEGNVWTITPSELLMIKYQPNAKQPLQSTSFKVNSLAQQVFYNPHTTFVDADGMLWIGATTGYQGINTHLLRAQNKEQSAAKKLVVGAVSINDNLLSPAQAFNGRSLLDQDVLYTRELRLRYNENNLVIECFQPCDDQYVTDVFYYQLKGLSDAWHPIDGHAIILSNLPPGNYQLMTRTQSSDAYSLLTIRIAPPFWFSWWAYCLYALLLAAVIYGIVRYYRNHHAYQLQLRELQLQQEQQTQMNELKLRFFTNISHDLRTPLSLIIGPVEEMLKAFKTENGENPVENGELRAERYDMTQSLSKTSSENAQTRKANHTSQFSVFNSQLEIVHRNAQHLLSLVNQILDFRRLELGKEKLLLSYGDLVTLLRDVCDSFRLKAEKEHIRFSFTPCAEQVETMFDRDKTTKIMMNLLSNAFKFTNQEGSIAVRLDVADGKAIVSVADTGVGISDADKANLFDRFYQSSLGNRMSMGSGIGLHIVREYVNLQGGEITVTDNTDASHGSIFSFTLPLKKGDRQRPAMPAETETAAPKPEAETAEPEAGIPTLLIVDDNPDLLSYMGQSLRDSYRIVTATNGAEALGCLDKQDIDMIVSDVMMPEVDGIELCRRVKTNIETSHIPIVLLTAKAMTSDELAGLEAGADDYVTKPFSMDILRQRLHNLMDRSHQHHERFAKEIDIEPSEITVTSLDEQFIARAIEIVEKHIAEPDFTVEQLSDEIGVHRAQLYKKLVHLTGKTPQQFVRVIRLKRGRQLLEQSGLYVSEVAYKVGFNSPRIFSKYFKEEFGITPKEFSKQE